MFRLQMLRCIRGFATRTAPMGKTPNAKKTQVRRRNPTTTTIYALQKLVTSETLEDDQIQQLYSSMKLELFMQNVTIALVNNKGMNIDNLLDFTINKFNEISKSAIDYNTHLPLVYTDKVSDKSYNLLYLIFQLALYKNLPSIAYTILINVTNKCLYEELSNMDQLVSTFLSHNNLSMLIDVLSISKTQQININDIDNIITLVSRYNTLAQKHSYEIYELNDTQMKLLFDKASSTLIKPPNSIETSPYGTLELLIREFGSIISKRVSYSISYYKPEAEKSNDIRHTEEEELSVQELLDRQILSKYLQFCYLFIHDRCQNNDPITIFNIWSVIKPFHNKLYNATINSETNNLSNNFYYYQTLAKMITIFSKNRRYRKLITEIIYDLPLDSVKICPELMSSILYHCGRTKNESLGSIVGSRYDDDTNSLPSLFGEEGDLSILGTGDKFTPGQVHAFLAYNLRLGNKKRSLEIVQYLKDKLIGFTSIDFNEVIRSILYTDHMKLKDQKSDSNNDIAWNMIITNKDVERKEINKYAYTTYLDYMVNNLKKKQLDFSRVNIIYNSMNQEFSRRDIKYWNYFYMCYFKYLTRKFPLQVAKKVYENNTRIASPGFRKIGDYGYEVNPFTERYNDVRIAMDDNLRVIVLRDIYQRSDGYLKRANALRSTDLEEAQKQYIEVSQWVYSELMGMSSQRKTSRNIVHSSIVVDLAKTIDRKSRELGFKLESAHDKKPKDTISEAERKYRVNSGEQIAIDDVSVDDDFQRSLVSTSSKWRRVFR